MIRQIRLPRLPRLLAPASRRRHAVTSRGPAPRTEPARSARPGGVAGTGVRLPELADADADLTLDSVLAGQLVRCSDEIRRAEVALAGSGGHMWQQKSKEARRRGVEVLSDIANVHGWPGNLLVGSVGCEAALLIATQADHQERARLRPALERAVRAGAVPAWHLQRLGSLTGTTADPGRLGAECPEGGR